MADAELADGEMTDGELPDAELLDAELPGCRAAVACAGYSVWVSVAATGTMVSVSIFGKGDPEDSPALAGLLAGEFAGLFDPAAGLFAFEPAWLGLPDGPAA